MAAKTDSAEEGGSKSAALRLAEEIKRRPLAAAAVAGGAAAAAAGAVVGARALAKRNGKRINQVLANAITATEAAAACQQGSDASPSPTDEAEGHPS
jgi:hypothetical protein